MTLDFYLSYQNVFSSLLLGGQTPNLGIFSFPILTLRSLALKVEGQLILTGEFLKIDQPVMGVRGPDPLQLCALSYTLKR